MILKRLLTLSFVLGLIQGCAETYLDEAEGPVLNSNPIKSTDNLVTMAAHSKKLSGAYVEAARRASKGQDVAAVVTFLAAGAFVSGAVGSASDTALANTALVGAGSTTIARRTVSKKTIEGIYNSAKRMNCVSTAAGMGAFLLDGNSPWVIGVARAATYGAIEEVKITTREALVRDVADFTKIRDDLIKASTLTKEQREGIEAYGRREADELVALNQYLSILDNCLGAIATATAVAPVPKDPG